MECPWCHAKHPDDHKYCFECGMPVDPQNTKISEELKSGMRSYIESLLAACLKDRDVVEVRTAVAVASKVSEWAKLFLYFVGIPIALLMTVLAGFGIKGYVDVLDLARKAENSAKEIETRLTSSKERIDASISVAQKQVDDTKQKGEGLLAELDRLRQQVEKNSRDVSALESKVRDVEFDRSAPLSTALQSKLEAALQQYQDYLAKIGFNSSQKDEKIHVRIDPSTRGEAYFDSENRLVLSSDLAGDSEYVLSEYTWSVLKRLNQKAYDRLLSDPSGQIQGFGQGLKFYFPCSFQNEPYVGKNYYALTGGLAGAQHPSYLFNLDPEKVRVLSPSIDEPHQIGEIWGGAFWEIRRKLTRDKSDQLLLNAWKDLKPPVGVIDTKFLVDAVRETKYPGKADADSAVIQKSFDRRNLK